MNLGRRNRWKRFGMYVARRRDFYGKSMVK
jgi:hypothetical protein